MGQRRGSRVRGDERVEKLACSMSSFTGFFAGTTKTKAFAPNPRYFLGNIRVLTHRHP
jgi:hypothetical protein